MMKITLKAKNAKEARSEIKARWPHLDVNYTGYDKNDESVLLSLVRKKGDKANIATVTRNRALPAVKFVAEIP